MDGVAELLPDREGLREPTPLLRRLVRRERLQLQCLGQAEPIEPPAGCLGGLIGGLTCPRAVSACERDPAGRIQRPRRVRPAVRDRALGESGGPLGVVVHQHLGELVEARDDALQIAGALGEGEPVLVGGARHRQLSPLPVDVAEADERVRALERACSRKDRGRRLVVDAGLVEPAKAPVREAAIHDGQREQARIAGHLRQPHRPLELHDRGLVGAVLEQHRAAVVVDPRHLLDVSGPLGMVERQAQRALHLVLVSRGLPDERERGVSSRKRLVVAAGRRHLERAARKRLRGRVLARAVVDARRPREQQRVVAGRSRVDRAASPHGLRGVEVVAELVHVHEPPGESGGQRARLARGTLEARQRAVVVAPNGVGLPGDLLDRR